MRPLFAISAAVLAARFGSPLSMTITPSSPPSTAMFPPAPVIRLNFPPRELETIGGALGDALGLGLAARAPGLRKLKAPGNAEIGRASCRERVWGWGDDGGVRDRRVIS